MQIQKHTKERKTKTKTLELQKITRDTPSEMAATNLKAVFSLSEGEFAFFFPTY